MSIQSPQVDSKSGQTGEVISPKSKYKIVCVKNDFDNTRNDELPTAGLGGLTLNSDGFQNNKTLGSKSKKNIQQPGSQERVLEHEFSSAIELDPSS